MGFPFNFHQENLWNVEFKGAEFIQKFKAQIVMTWSSSEGHLSAVLQRHDVIFFVDSERPYIGFWFRGQDGKTALNIQMIMQDIRSFTTPLPETPPEPTYPEISLLLSDPMTGNFNELHRKMKTWPHRRVAELELLYDFDKFLELADFMQNEEGLAILQGVPGGGKTSLIRDVITYLAFSEDEPRDNVYLTADNIAALGSEKFIHYFLKNPGRCLICEDAEAALSPANGVRTKSTSNLLNLTDGMLSDVALTPIVTTINTELKNIDSALLRDGRCKILWTIEPHNEQGILKYWEYMHSTYPEDYLPPQSGCGSLTIAQFGKIARKS
jgi:hypothetical protein